MASVLASCGFAYDNALFGSPLVNHQHVEISLVLQCKLSVKGDMFPIVLQSSVVFGTPLEQLEGITSSSNSNCDVTTARNEKFCPSLD